MGLLNNVKYDSFLNTAFRDFPCLTHGTVTGLWFQKKSNITNMITLTFAFPRNNLLRLHLHFCGLKQLIVSVQ